MVLDRVPPYSTDAQIFGVHDGERITFQGRFEEVVVDTNELLTSGATEASTRVDIDGQWIDAHFTARAAQVTFDSCGDHPFHVTAELNVVTA